MTALGCLAIFVVLYGSLLETILLKTKLRFEIQRRGNVRGILCYKIKLSNLLHRCIDLSQTYSKIPTTL